MKESETKQFDAKSELQDANACMAIGAGVGAMGIGGALVLGAVCPVCYVAAPGLIALGALKRRKLLKQKTVSESSDNS